MDINAGLIASIKTQADIIEHLIEERDLLLTDREKLIKKCDKLSTDKEELRNQYKSLFNHVWEATSRSMRYEEMLTQTVLQVYLRDQPEVEDPLAALVSERDSLRERVSVLEKQLAEAEDKACFDCGESMERVKEAWAETERHKKSAEEMEKACKKQVEDMRQTALIRVELLEKSAQDTNAVLEKTKHENQELRSALDALLKQMENAIKAPFEEWKNRIKAAPDFAVELARGPDGLCVYAILSSADCDYLPGAVAARILGLPGSNDVSNRRKFMKYNFWKNEGYQLASTQ